MFAQILRTHWQWTRAAVGALAIGTFVAPAFIWRLADSTMIGVPEAQAVIQGFAAVGVVLGVLSLFGAFALAALPWGVDAATQHVYPLSLPIPWARYLTMRYAAGVLTLIIPAVTLWLGCLVALSMITIPDVLQSYAGTLAFRFFLAALLAYSATFAVQYVAGRKAAYTIVVLFLAALLLGFAVGVVGGRDDLVESALKVLFEWPGPFAIYTDPWVLIDV
jgi:hypothetical protein